MSKKLLLLPLLALLAIPILLLLDSGEPTGQNSEAAGRSAQTTTGSAAGPAELRSAAPSESELATSEAPAEELARSAVSAPTQRSSRSTAKTRPMVQGRVVDVEGRPVADAEIKMKRPGEAMLAIAGLSASRTEEGLTDGFGRFDLPGKPGEEVTFTVVSKGFLEYDRTLMLPESLAAPIEDLVLKQGFVVWGTVVDPTGRPIAGAEVDHFERSWRFSRGDDEPEIICGEDGKFELSAVSPGDWSIVVEAPGHPRRIFRGEDEGRGRRATELVCELPYALTISGQVKNVPPQRLSQVRVSATNSEESTSRFSRTNQPFMVELKPDGKFLIEQLDPDITYELSAQGGNDLSVVYSGGSERSARSDKVVVPAGTKNVELLYKRGADVKFAVIGADTGEPLESFVAEIGQMMVKEELTEPSGEIRTHHPGGRDQFMDLRPTAFSLADNEPRWTLTVRASGYVPLRKEDLFVPPTGQVDIGVLELQPAPKLTVRVLDDASGKPVRSAQVILSVETPEIDDESGMRGFAFGRVMAEPARRERTDKNGEVTISSFGTQRSSLRISKARYASHEQDGIVVGESDSTLEIRLLEEGEITVEVVDGDGNPMDDTRVEILAPDPVPGDGDERDARTRSDGTVSFRKLQAGRWGFRIAGDSGRGQPWMVRGNEQGEWTYVSVKPGSEQVVVLRGPYFSVASGTVQINGAKASGGTVFLAERNPDQTTPAGTAGNWTPHRDRLDEQGRFSMEKVPYGNYWLTVQNDALAVQSAHAVTIDSPAESFEINAVTASVSGRVLDGAGRPVAGVSVRADPENATKSGTWWKSDLRGSGPTSSNVVPVESSLAALVESEDRGLTDSDGRYTITGLTPDRPMVVQAGGDFVLSNQSEPFTVTAGELLEDVEIKVQPAGAFLIKVEQGEDQGQPRFFRVQVLRLDGSEENTRQYSENLWDSRPWLRGGIEPGRYRLEIRERERGFSRAENQESEPSYTAEIEVIAGQQTDHIAVIP